MIYLIAIMVFVIMCHLIGVTWIYVTLGLLALLALFLGAVWFVRDFKSLWLRRP